MYMKYITYCKGCADNDVIKDFPKVNVKLKLSILLTS